MDQKGVRDERKRASEQKRAEYEKAKRVLAQRYPARACCDDSQQQCAAATQFASEWAEFEHMRRDVEGSLRQQLAAVNKQARVAAAAHLLRQNGGLSSVCAAR